MRKLSIKQKKMIMGYVESTFMTGRDRLNLLYVLEGMNDYETLTQDMDRFLQDYSFSYDCASDGQGGRYLLNWRDWR